MANQLATAFDAFLELLTLPAKNPNVMWTVTPLLIVTVIMFFYFQRYKDEELGWNSAVANSLVSIFISISMLRDVYFLTMPGSVDNFTDFLSKTIFSLILFFLGFFLLIINFEHLLPKKVAYFISSPLSINLIAYLGIIFVNSSLGFDFTTFLVLVIFLAFLRLLLSLIQKPVEKLFLYLKQLKVQEIVEDIEKKKESIKKEKKEITEEVGIKVAKKMVKSTKNNQKIKNNRR